MIRLILHPLKEKIFQRQVTKLGLSACSFMLFPETNVYYADAWPRSQRLWGQ